MSFPAPAEQLRVEERARQSLGHSNTAIYEMVERALGQQQINGDTILDVGCGVGNLKQYVSKRFKRYIGVDVVCYVGFPSDAEFH